MIKQRISLLIVILFVVISLFVSVYMLFQQSIRLDEAQSLWVATKTIPGIIEYLSKDVQTPLYHVILHFWLMVFGNNIVAARALSFIFFILSMPILYILARQSTNRTVSLLTVALYSLSPFIIWYSFEARTYSLLTLVTCFAHYYFLKMIRTNGEKGDVGYFFSVLIGLFTHYFFFFVIFSQFFYLIVWYMKKKKEQAQEIYSISKNKNVLNNFFVPVIIAVCIFIPWVLYFLLRGAASETQPLIDNPSIYSLLQTIVNFLFGFQSTSIQSLLVALWPLSLVPIFLIFSKREVDAPFENIRYFLIMTILPIALVFLISFVKPVYLVRYLIFTIPSFFLLFSWILFHISRQVSTAILTIFAFIMFGFLMLQNFSNATPVKEDYKSVSSYLFNKTSPNDVVLVTAPFTIYPLDYYYKGSAVVVTIPEWDVYNTQSIPPFSIENLEKQLDKYENSYDNMYVVLSYDQGYEDDLKKYLDNNYKRLELKNFSPGLELRKYQLKYE